MAKLAIVFFAVLAFQAAFADQDATKTLKKRFRVQAVSAQIQTFSNNAARAVENVQTGTNQEKRSLANQANEYAHQIQQAVYQLNKAIQNNQDDQGNQGQNQQQLKDVSHQLSEIAHSVQQTINSEPSQLKAQLKTAVQNAAGQAQKLSQAVQQPEQKASFQQRQATVNSQVRDVVDTILSATQKVLVHSQHRQETPEALKAKIDEVSTKVSDAVKSIKSDDQQTAEELVDQIQAIAQVIENIVSDLENWAHDNHDQTKNVNVIQEVSQKLAEIEVNLRQVASNQGNGNPQVASLKNQLDTNFHNAAVQIQKLAQVEQSGNENEQVGQTAKQLVDHVLVQSYAGATTLHTQLQLTAQGPQNN